jgi:FixJ family two-component response regulator
MSFVRSQFVSCCWLESLSFSNAHRWIHQLRDVPIISIIDDDESIRSGTLRLVRSLGFIGYAFSSAHAFLNSEQLIKTSCLISDIHMPEMSGIQLQETLRARGYDVPIIFITAFPDEKIRAQALAQGAVCFLEKPFEGEALSCCIDSALKDSADKDG